MLIPLPQLLTDGITGTSHDAQTAILFQDK